MVCFRRLGPSTLTVARSARFMPLAFMCRSATNPNARGIVPGARAHLGGASNIGACAATTYGGTTQRQKGRQYAEVHRG